MISVVGLFLAQFKRSPFNKKNSKGSQIWLNARTANSSLVIACAKYSLFILQALFFRLEVKLCRFIWWKETLFSYNFVECMNSTCQFINTIIPVLFWWNPAHLPGIQSIFSVLFHFILKAHKSNHIKLGLLLLFLQKHLILVKNGWLTVRCMNLTNSQWLA